MELSEAFKILEGDPELQCKYGNDGDDCINPQIAKDEAILTIKNYIEFQTIPKKKIEDKIDKLNNKILKLRKENNYSTIDEIVLNLAKEILQELLEDK